MSRAVSAYWHHFSQGRFDLPTSLFQIPTELGVVDMGFYRRHWEHWHTVFGDRLQLLFYDDLIGDPKKYLGSALAAIGAPSTETFWRTVDLTERHNQRPWVKVFQERRNAVRPLEIAALLSLYQDDIRFVEELSGRSLDHWRDLDALIGRHCRTTQQT